MGSDTERLLPCPFCGHDAVLMCQHDLWYVCCANDSRTCCVSPGSSPMYTKRGTINAWNRRVHLAQQAPAEPCDRQEYSSRICQHGTRNCVVDHSAMLAASPVAEPEANRVGAGEREAFEAWLVTYPGFGNHLDGRLAWAAWQARAARAAQPQPAEQGWEQNYNYMVGERDKALVEVERLSTAPKCPTCGSHKTAPTKGNAVGNATDCLECGTDFTTAQPAAREELLQEAENLADWLFGTGHDMDSSPRSRDGASTIRKLSAALRVYQARDAQLTTKEWKGGQTETKSAPVAEQRPETKA